MATPMAMPVPGIQAERDHALDWVKWLALVAMVLDHLWFVLPAEWQDPGYGLRVAGRKKLCLQPVQKLARVLLPRARHYGFESPPRRGR